MRWRWTRVELSRATVHSGWRRLPRSNGRKRCEDLSSRGCLEPVNVERISEAPRLLQVSVLAWHGKSRDPMRVQCMWANRSVRRIDYLAHRPSMYPRGRPQASEACHTPDRALSRVMRIEKTRHYLATRRWEKSAVLASQRPAFKSLSHAINSASN